MFTALLLMFMAGLLLRIKKVKYLGGETAFMVVRLLGTPETKEPYGQVL